MVGGDDGDSATSRSGARARRGDRLAGRLPLVAAALATTLVVAVAAIDLASVEADVPAVPPPCPPGPEACHDARNARLGDRLDEISRLEASYEARAWAYSLAVISVAGVAAAMALRARPPERRRPVFTALGVGGAWLALAVTALLLVGSGPASVRPPLLPAYVPSAAMWIAAAAGLVLLRRAPAAAGRTVRLAAAARRLGLGAAGLTAATVTLAVAYALPQPPCDAPRGGTAPEWTDALAVAATVSAAAAVALGIAALIAGRWIAALGTLAVNPYALLMMVASTCGFY